MRFWLTWLVWASFIGLLWLLPWFVSRIILLVLAFGGIVLIIYSISNYDNSISYGSKKPLKKKKKTSTKRIKTIYLENDVIHVTSKMRWGKFKGITVSSLPPSYFRWLISRSIDIDYYEENEPYISTNPNDRNYGISHTYEGRPIRMIEDED